MISRRHVAIAVALMLTFLASGCQRLLHSNGVTIQVVNSSSQFIRNVEVEFPGGSFGIAALRPGGTRARWVRIIGSGLLKLAFVDDKGEHHAAAMRLNPDDAGSVKLEFGGDGKLAFTDLRQSQ